jgi:transcriptional regulator with XRE-family HTH domain
MSFSKNIKKIRLIKKLSQTALAEIFGIKRSSIGAYEEGRAEPKLEMIIRIANYFSISVDSLVNSELTVNELYGLDVVDSYLSSSQSSKENFAAIETIPIPLVSTADILIKPIEAVCNDSTKQVCLPGTSPNQIAILIDETGFKYLPRQIHKNDLIIVDAKFTLSEDELPVNNLYLVKWGRTMGIGEMKNISDAEYIFITSNNIPVVILKNDLHFIFPIEKHVSNNPQIFQEETDRIHKLETLIDDLYRRIK